MNATVGLTTVGQEWIVVDWVYEFDFVCAERHGSTEGDKGQFAWRRIQVGDGPDRIESPGDSQPDSEEH
jgi:hypothetical protein